MVIQLKEKPKLSTTVKVFDNNGNAFDYGGGQFDPNCTGKIEFRGNGKI